MGSWMTGIGQKERWVAVESN